MHDSYATSVAAPLLDHTNGHTEDLYDIEGWEYSSGRITTLRFKRTLAANPADSWDYDIDFGVRSVVFAWNRQGSDSLASYHGPNRGYGNVRFWSEGEGQTCPIGLRRFTNATGSYCIPCPAGEELQAGSLVCSICQAGKSSVEGGRCTDCRPGYYSDGEGLGACRPCSSNMYQALTGALSCNNCPPNTASIEGSPICDMCAPGTFRRDEEPASEATCLRCVRGAECPYNTTVSTLTIRSGHWRASSRTTGPRPQTDLGLAAGRRAG